MQNFRLDEPALRRAVVIHGGPWLRVGVCWRRACATSTATAQLAIRERTLSARLVRMTGTRAPSTMPALSALARYVSCLASMLPDSRFRHEQDVRISGRLAIGCP
jgi:hypothetical protein